MSQIEELQSRITSAMDRIGAGVAALNSAQSADSGLDESLAELNTRLDEERLANAQLEERVATLKAKHDDALAALRAELDTSVELEGLRAQQATQSQAMAQMDMDVQRLRQANDQLRDSNAALRQANEEGVGEPHLINKAMLAELEGLRAVQATDAAEVSAVLAKLGPLLAGAENLIEGEDA
jgi:predicted  nucleic acid-binding Zn-ribbon protein